MESLLGLPLGASAHAAELDRMTVIVHWLMLVLFVGWGAFFAFTLLRFRKARNPVADYAGVKSHFSSYTEIGVAVIEAVLLIGFAIPAWAVRVNEVPVEAESTVVRLMGAAVRVARALSRTRRPLRTYGHRTRDADQRHRTR